MGFFDKVKDAAKQIKEENKNFGSTMKRMNNRNAFYGNVNRGIKNGDFWEGSYVNIEGSNGVIYGSAQDDYTFAPGDVKNCTFSGKGPDIAVGNEKKPSMRFILEFADGKKAQADIIFDKVDLFKASFGL